MKFFLSIFFPYDVDGLENLKNSGDSFVLCSNHVSNLDPIFLLVITQKKIRFLAKIELFKNILFSIFLKDIFGAIPINRGNHDSNAITYAENVLKNGEILGIFIEGTRSKGGNFLRPKNGAVIIANNTDSNILPVCITPADKKVKVFKKTKISFGKLIKISDLNITNEYKNIRQGTEFVMNKIKALRH